MRFLSLIFCLMLPLAAAAQNHSDAPLLAVSNGDVIAPLSTTPTPSSAPASMPAPAAAFPPGAVTAITRDVNGQQIVGPAPAPSPAQPASPVAPVSKLWPSDAAAIFMQSCVKFHQQLVPPCHCIITGIMNAMPHDEFMRLSDAGTLAQDPRILAIQQQCATAPRQHGQ